jgi:hypothetical protein
MGNQWHFGIKAHIGVDADSGLVHTVVGTAANVSDVTQTSSLVHGEESDVFADAGYQGVSKREETQDIDANWHVAMRPGKRKALDRDTPVGIGHGQARTCKGQHPGQGGAPVSGHQAPVRACEGARPRLGQEHGAVANAVRIEQLVDSASNAFSRGPEMSAPATTQETANGPQIGLRMNEIALWLPPSETSSISTRRCGCCADLP